MHFKSFEFHFLFYVPLSVELSTPFPCPAQWVVGLVLQQEFIERYIIKEQVNFLIFLFRIEWE